MALPYIDTSPAAKERAIADAKHRHRANQLPKKEPGEKQGISDHALRKHAADLCKVPLKRLTIPRSTLDAQTVTSHPDERKRRKRVHELCPKTALSREVRPYPVEEGKSLLDFLTGRDKPLPKIPYAKHAKKDKKRNR